MVLDKGPAHSGQMANQTWGYFSSAAAGDVQFETFSAEGDINRDH